MGLNRFYGNKQKRYKENIFLVLILENNIFYNYNLSRKFKQNSIKSLVPFFKLAMKKRY